MRSKAANHLHRYKKVNLAKNGKEYWVYRCTKPACSHYIPIDLAEGRLCECNRCGEAMIIGRETMTKSSGRPMTLPHCGNCIKRKKDYDVDTIQEFLDGVKVTD